jgi:flagellar assembly factor FliW
MPATATKYFGKLTYGEDSVVHFPAGLLGFPQHRRFLLIQHPAMLPLTFLQSLEDPDLCFPAMPATQADPRFELHLDADSGRLLGEPAGQMAAGGESLLVLAMVTFDEAGPTANLAGPVVIHVSSKIGAQVVQYDFDYPARHPVPAVGEVLSCW